MIYNSQSKVIVTVLIVLASLTAMATLRTEPTPAYSKPLLIVQAYQYVYPTQVATQSEPVGVSRDAKLCVTPDLKIIMDGTGCDY